MRTPEYELCAEAQRALEYGLHDVAAKIAKVIESGAWKTFVTPTGRTVTNATFTEFVLRAQPDGLGTDLTTVRNVCRDTTWALDLLDRELQQPHGGDRRSPEAQTKSDIVPLDPNQRGNSADGALRRLRKDRPDLHERVLDGELSAHGAAVAAGFRSQRFSIPGDPTRAAEIIRRHFSDRDRQLLIERLVDPQ